MKEEKKKNRSLAVVVMLIIMTFALCMTLISCGGDEGNAPEDGTKAKTEKVVADNEKSDEIESSDEKAKSGEKKSQNSNKSATKEEQKSTTAATEQAKQVCYISIEGYCSSKEISLQGGDTAYSILCRSGATVSGSGHYIKGINGRFEFDEGPSSGWTYYVNGNKPAVGCGSYSVKAGDSITWDYVTSF